MADHTDTHKEHPYADPELKKYLRMVARANKTHAVIWRALLTGIFAAVGTTIGFALLLIVAAALITNLRQIPILDTILQQTKLDVLIEDQLSRIQKGAPDSGQNVSIETYTDATYGLSLEYPSTFSSISQGSVDDTGKIIQLRGSGALQALDIYINRPAVVTGDATQTQVSANKLNLRITVSVYEKGAKINGVEYQNAIYQAKFKQGKNEYIVVGQADSGRPKLAREVFVGIIESLGFSK